MSAYCVFTNITPAPKYSLSHMYTHSHGEEGGQEEGGRETEYEESAKWLISCEKKRKCKGRNAQQNLKHFKLKKACIIMFAVMFKNWPITDS